ncbi:TetR/AcrR family transcriptional regulator [uncultured Amnibacterium sp.]|uniref:TetR/AcrR family transcriptional regulator n=1 Tax=uncultured Amnibacterium sp. TaxID=1631851 RepID=UPI0035C9E295
MRADAERNNARILEAARALVRRRGADVSMDEIAGEAGVAVGTLYRHHPTKAALLEAVIADGLGDWATLAEGAAQRVADGADAGGTLADLVRRIAVMHAADRTVKATAATLGARVTELSGPFPAGGVEARVVGAVELVLRAAVEAGAVRADLTSADLALLIGGVPDDEEQARRYAELVLAGMLTPR